MPTSLFTISVQDPLHVLAQPTHVFHADVVCSPHRPQHTHLAEFRLLAAYVDERGAGFGGRAAGRSRMFRLVQKLVKKLCGPIVGRFGMQSHDVAQVRLRYLHFDQARARPAVGPPKWAALCRRVLLPRLVLVVLCLQSRRASFGLPLPWKPSCSHTHGRHDS